MAFAVVSNPFKQSQECTEVPDEQCEEKDIKVPKQEKEHKKKCLLADDDSLPPTPAPSYPSPPAPTPAPSYPSPSPSYPTPAVQTNVLRSNSNITFIETFGNGQFSSISNIDQV